MFKSLIMAEKKPKVYIYSMGCTRRLLDATKFLTYFRANGYEIVESPQESDFILLNTCAFKKSQEDFAIEKIQELKKYNKVNVAGIYTHLATADDPGDNKFPNDQIKKFKEIVLYFENKGFNFQYKHVNATSGLFRFNDPDFNITRVGIGLFSISPFPKHTKLNKQFKDNLKPVLKLKTLLVDTK